MALKGTLIVQDTVVAFTRVVLVDFISLVDIDKVKNPQPKGAEFDPFKLEAGKQLLKPM